jgi:hypothetical protein
MNSLKRKPPASAVDLSVGDDSAHDALLPTEDYDRDPSRIYEEETQEALMRKEQQLDAKSHRKKLLGWLSYAFARSVLVVTEFLVLARLYKLGK